MKETEFYRASDTPQQDLEELAYEGQDPRRRQFLSGYENYLNAFPVVDPNDCLFQMKLNHSKYLMEHLADVLDGGDLPFEVPIPAGEFARTILSMESKEPTFHERKGVEILIGQWGDGLTVPVHGHGGGYKYEGILTGKMRYNTYHLIDAATRTVRPTRTVIASSGTYTNIYAESPDGANLALIHNFTPLGYTATLHFVPEHTKDGKGNTFTTERFGNRITMCDVKVTLYEQGVVGDVFLIRSEPDFGDHYLVITGGKYVMIHAPETEGFLNQFNTQTGKICLKFSPRLAKEFMSFHGINEVDGKYILADEQP